jgi:EAL domain-containing protein (putative c-di-GMP-specific phosphodiesterase class I)
VRTRVDELAVILGTESISTAFQPIVDLTTEAVVGYEALSRGPHGSPLQMPIDLFDAAQSAHRVVELDWLCRVAALQCALDVGIRPPLTVFLNIEPEALTPAPEHAGPVLARAMGGLRVIVELTERSLFGKPARLLRFVETVRRYGWGLAVDDIGTHPHSLAVLSIVEPDVVKIEQPALKTMPHATSSALISGVQTYCRRSGARVVAEGLETEDDVETARALGAHYGQGWRFGPAVTMTAAPAPTAAQIPMINPRPHLPSRRLIHLLARTDTAQQGDRDSIDRLSCYLFEHAAEMGPNTLVIVGVQNAGFINPPVRAALRKLASRVAYMAVLGADVGAQSIPRAHGVRLAPTDPLVSEWVIAMIGLQEAIAVVASDAGDELDAGPARRYQYAVTYDPQLVTDIARALLSRVT